MVNLANPTTFVKLTRRVLPWLVASTAILFVAGLWLSFVAPPTISRAKRSRSCTCMCRPRGWRRLSTA